MFGSMPVSPPVIGSAPIKTPEVPAADKIPYCSHAAQYENYDAMIRQRFQALIDRATLGVTVHIRSRGTSSFSLSIIRSLFDLCRNDSQALLERAYALGCSVYYLLAVFLMDACFGALETPSSCG